MKLSEDELNSNRIVIVSYPGNCGGKFLINCLGLSTGAVFQDYNLARDQLDRKIGTFDKHNFILDSLKKERPGGWDDLGLGCHQLFQTWPAVNAEQYSTEVISLIKELIKQNKYFFIVVHVDQIAELEHLLQHWTNPTCLNLLNCKSSWDNADNIAVEKLQKFLLLKWQVPWYDNLASTLMHVEELYIKMELDDFDEDLITEYYNNWKMTWTQL